MQAAAQTSLQTDLSTGRNPSQTQPANTASSQKLKVVRRHFVFELGPQLRVPVTTPGDGTLQTGLVLLGRQALVQFPEWDPA